MSARDQPEESSTAALEADEGRGSDAGMRQFACHILTIFPEFFASPLDTSILRRGREAGLLDVRVHDIRQWATDRHRTTDDTPYGGGAGMVMKPEPIVSAIEAIEAEHGRQHRVLLTPQGRPFTQARARALAEHRSLLLLCGRYEGVDERVRDGYIDEELTIGDYVLTGGEPAALVVVDAVARLFPGVLGNESSSAEESFSDPRLLEYPHYTRPYEFRGALVPDVLRSGDHGAIARWRRRQALLRTWQRRPELFRALVPELGKAERDWLTTTLDRPWPEVARGASDPDAASRPTRAAAQIADGLEGEPPTVRGHRSATTSQEDRPEDRQEVRHEVEGEPWHKRPKVHATDGKSRPTAEPNGQEDREEGQEID